MRDGQNAVVTCSALKENYRAVVVPDPAQVKLVYLKGSRDILAQRLGDRSDHFMKPDMLDSQLDALEEPLDALVADITEPPDRITARIRQTLSL